jgi:putative acetyltransferase
VQIRYDIRKDDLSGEETRALLALHLQGMHASSPPGTVFALDLTGLTAPEVTAWTAWRDGRVASIGALKMLPDGNAEVKSMRTHPDFLKMGAGAGILEHIIAEARRRGVRRLSLETGRGPAFEPALALYRRRGFVDGEAFSDYRPGEFSQFLHLSLAEPAQAAGGSALVQPASNRTR